MISKQATVKLGKNITAPDEQTWAEMESRWKNVIADVSDTFPIESLENFIEELNKSPKIKNMLAQGKKPSLIQMAPLFKSMFKG